MPDLVEDVHVRMIAPDSPTALALAIEDLAGNEGLRVKMGGNARALAANFTWDNIALRTAAFYEELCRQR